jgi:hypothetical protein
LVLGSGRRLFEPDDTFAELRLVDAATTTTNVILATYEPVDDHASVVDKVGSAVRLPSGGT